MTKQQRKEIYWAAMFEMVAFGGGIMPTLDYLCNRIVPYKDVPEIMEANEGFIYGYGSMVRLSHAIDLCESKTK